MIHIIPFFFASTAGQRPSTALSGELRPRTRSGSSTTSSPSVDPIIILTGGEPMMRPDIYDIAKYGTDLGLRMVMAPCGLLVTEELAQKMKDSGHHARARSPSTA